MIVQEEATRNIVHHLAKTGRVVCSICGFVTFKGCLNNGLMPDHGSPSTGYCEGGCSGSGLPPRDESCYRVK